MQPGLSGNPFCGWKKQGKKSDFVEPLCQVWERKTEKAAQIILFKIIKINQQRNPYHNSVPAPRFETVFI